MQDELQQDTINGAPEEGVPVEETTAAVGAEESAAPEVAPEKTKRNKKKGPKEMKPDTKKTAAKKKAPAKKTAAKKAPAKKTAAATAGTGRKSAYAGYTIKVVKTIEQTRIRDTGNVRTCWDAMRDGMTVEKYREAAVRQGQHSGHALAVLRVFARDGYVKLIRPPKA